MMAMMTPKYPINPMPAAEYAFSAVFANDRIEPALEIF